MADFSTANLEGANDLLNQALTDAKTLKDKLLAKHGDDASAILGDVESLTADLKSSVSKMIPELPTVQNQSVQAEFAALKDMDITTAAGKKQFDAKVANIKESFGPALKEKGIDLDDMSSKVQSGAADIGDSIPNLQLSADGTSIELPSNISLPSIEALKEELEKMPDFKIEIDSDLLKEKANEALDAIDKLKKDNETESKLTLV